MKGTAQEVVEALETPLETTISNLENSLDQLSKGIDQDLEKALTDITTQQEGYRGTVRNYKSGGIALTVLSYMAALGAIGEAVPLFMDYQALTALADQAISSSYVTLDGSSIIWNGNTAIVPPEFFEKLTNLNNSSTPQVDVISLHNGTGPHMIGGVVTCVIAAMIVSSAWSIVFSMEGKGHEKVEDNIRHQLLGLKQPVLLQEAVKDAVAAVDKGENIQPRDPNINGEPVALLGKLCNRLSSFSKTLEQEAKKAPDAQKQH